METLTIRQRIRTDGYVSDFLNEGDRFVGDISKCYELYRKANTRLSEFKQNGIRLLKERVDEIEGEVAFDVLQAIGDDNKPKYKNEGQRKAALDRELKGNPGWITAKALLQKAEQTETQMYQDAFKCEHDVKIARFYFDVWQSRMLVIAGLSNEQQEHRHHLIAETNVTIGGNNAEKTD